MLTRDTYDEDGRTAVASSRQIDTIVINPNTQA